MKHLYILLTIACIAFYADIRAQTFYVNGTSGNDKNEGTSWGKAFKTFSKALQTAESTTAAKKILVANGIYYPAGTKILTLANEDSSFLITKGGLKIYGGYDPQTHQINTKSATIFAGNNCHHVCIIASLPATADSIVFDGITITGGFANGAGGKIYCDQLIPSTRGGGIYILNNKMGGKLMFKNCTVSNNYASEGGGFYNDHSSPAIISCNFIGNKVSNLGGAAIYNNAGAPQMVSCNFQHNGEGMNGGAVYTVSTDTVQSPVFISNCNFTDNMVDQMGAGIYVQGGLLNIANCTFSGNESFCSGGSSAGGGGIYFAAASAFITNSSFYGNNVASAAGAGIFSEKSDLTISNCTFSGNNSKYGGVLCSRGNQSNIKIYNSILYGNSSCIDKYGNGNMAVNYCIIDDGYNGLGNYNTDPLLVNAPAFTNAPFCNVKGSRAQYLNCDYHLKTGSLAIDTGSNNFYTNAGGRLSDSDLAGKTRFWGHAIDLGAYEYQSITGNNILTGDDSLPKAAVGTGSPRSANK